MMMRSFSDTIQGAIEAVGLTRFRRVQTLDATTDPNHVQIFEARPIRLRFTRDRGEDFVDIAASDRPDQFFMFDDLEVAMGWRQTSDVLAKLRPDPLGLVLRQLSTHLPQVIDAFSASTWDSTQALLEKASAERTRILESRLR